MLGSALHLMGDISAVLGHFPGAQSGRPSPWYQGLHTARVARLTSRKIDTEVLFISMITRRLLGSLGTFP